MKKKKNEVSKTEKKEKIKRTVLTEDKWSWKHVGMIFLIFISTMAVTVLTQIMKSRHVGDWLLLGLSGSLFCIFLVISLEAERIEKGIYDEKSNNFVRIAVSYTICCVLTWAMSFLPEYGRPVLIVSIIMSIASTPFTGLLAGCYSSILLGYIGEQSIPLFSCYLLMCIIGCIITQYLQKDKNLIWGSFMILVSDFCLTTIFSMLEGGELDQTSVIYSVLSGVISASLLVLLFQLWNDTINSSKTIKLETLLEETYELSQTIQNFSQADYNHARKVSQIAGNCAEKMGLNAPLARAAGMYYRVGRLEGEPYVENGVMVAMKHNFPPELVQILREYNGEKQLPSTVESALVHIVDNVVAKFDVLDRTTLSSSWNQDIVVYQTLNDNSARGLYDKSGLSMNMFLQVRDYLIKEAQLYDGDC